MGSLSNLYISQSYTSLAHLGTNNALVPGTMTILQDGLGQSLNISFDGTNISSSGNIFGANLTASVVNTGSFASTSSFNAYTSSTNIRLNNLENTSASVNISVSNLNSTTQSLNTSISNLNTATSSLFASASLGLVTASVSVNILTFTKGDGSQFNLTVSSSGSVTPGTISGSAQITAFGFVSSSVTASSLVTASFDNGTRNLTFTKGDSTTFAVNIPDVSGSTGNFATTGSNTFRGNQTISGSVRVTGSVIGSKISAFDFDSLFYGSQLGGTIANGTFFGYGSSDYTFILGAYTGVFDSELQIKADNTGITFGDFNGASYPSWLKLLPNTGTNPKPIMTRGLEVTGSTNIAELTASLQQGYVWVGNASGKTTTVATSSFGGGSVPAGTISSSAQITSLGFVSSSVTASSLITASVSGTTMTFTKGDASTFNVTLPTGSGGGTTNTGSLMLTGSVSVNVLTFTKGDGTTFDLTVAASGSAPAGTVSSSAQIVNYNIFATTGSNTFVGDQTVNAKLIVSGSSNSYIQFSSPNSATGSGAIFFGNNGSYIQTYSAGANPDNQGLQLVAGLSGSFALATRYAGPQGEIDLQALVEQGVSNQQSRLRVKAGSGISATSTDSISISGSSTTIQDVNFIPFSASVNSRLLSGGINTGSFATTGSNTFNGNQIINGRFTNNTPTASSESQIDFFKLPTFLGANGTSYPTATFSLFDYASAGIDQTFGIEYANATFEKYSALYVGPSRTQFFIGKGSGYDYDVIELLDNNNNTSTAKVKANTIQLQGTTQLTGSLTISSSAAVELNVIGNSIFTGSLNVSGSATIIGQLKSTFNAPADNTEVQLMKVNSFTDSTGYVMANNTFGWYRYSSEGHQGFSSNLYTADYSFGSAFFHDSNKFEYLLFPSGAAYDTNKFGLYDNGNTTTTFQVIADSTQITGSLRIQSGSGMPSQIGTSLVTWNSATGQIGQATTTTLISSSFSAGEFFSSTTLSGSAGVSASIALPNTAISNGVSIQSGSQMVVSNSGTYNIQFSAQADAFSGADTVWIWFKKNGTNIADSASKLVMQNNTAAIMTVNIFDNGVPNDYYEVVWQNNAGYGKLISDVATGNIPAIPSVIVTVNQVK
jgi:hypothetical protein